MLEVTVLYHGRQVSPPFSSTEPLTPGTPRRWEKTWLPGQRASEAPLEMVSDISLRLRTGKDETEEMQEQKLSPGLAFSPSLWPLP